VLSVRFALERINAAMSTSCANRVAHSTASAPPRECPAITIFGAAAASSRAELTALR